MPVSCRKTVVGRVFTAKANANIRSFLALPRVWIPTTSFVAARTITSLPVRRTPDKFFGKQCYFNVIAANRVAQWECGAMACDLCTEPHFQRGPDWVDPFLCQPGRE
jgi:hypothetical protein